MRWRKYGEMAFLMSRNANKHVLLALCVDCTVKTKLLFYCSYSISTSTMRWHKYGEMAFLMSRNENKHVLLALGVDCTARDAVKAKFTGVPSMFPRYVGLVLPSLTRRQVNAVELAISRSLMLT